MLLRIDPRVDFVSKKMLPKFSPKSDNAAVLPADQKWLYLFTRAAEMDTGRLSELLGDDAFREAIGVLEMISKTPEDYQYYQDRLKFLRDEEAKLADAKQEGLEQGLEQGLERGMLVGKIQLIQSLLEEATTPKEVMLAMDFDDLSIQLAELQQRLRDRAR